MTANLKVINAIIAEVEADGFRGIDKQTLLDTLQSLSKVGGTMSFKDGGVPFICTGSWETITTWTSSRDTQGLSQDFVAGAYTCTAEGAGDYTVATGLRFQPDTDGVYQMRISTQYLDVLTAVAGTERQLLIPSGLLKNITELTPMFVEFKGPNGATVTPVFGQFGVVR
jgi:hypothetical protein